MGNVLEKRHLLQWGDWFDKVRSWGTQRRKLFTATTGHWRRKKMRERFLGNGLPKSGGDTVHKKDC